MHFKLLQNDQRKTNKCDKPLVRLSKSIRKKAQTPQYQW